ncbi:hypothetical protein V2J09_018394, partial [Rumex salicifolius]
WREGTPQRAAEIAKQRKFTPQSLRLLSPYLSLNPATTPIGKSLHCCSFSLPSNVSSLGFSKKGAQLAAFIDLRLLNLTLIYNMSEAEDVSQVSAEAEHLDQSVCGNLTRELSKDGAGLLSSNQFRLTTKLEDASIVSTNHMSVELIDNSSNYEQLVRVPPCDAHSQNHLCETSEQNNPVNEGSLQSNLVKSSSMMSGLRHSERLKRCLSPGKFATERACGHGHDSVDAIQRDAVEETLNVPVDVVHGQLMSNSSIGVSELKNPGGGINKSPDNIAGGCTEVPNKDVNDQVRPSFQDVSNKSICKRLEPLSDDKYKSTNNLHQVVVVLALKSSADDYARKKTGAIQKASCRKSGTKSNPSTLNGSISRSSGRRHRKTPETKVNSEYALRSSSTDRQRGQRPIIQEKSVAIEPDCQLENASSGKKRGRKKGQINRETNDEFSRMRVHLRYLLHRIRYEQNLIDAYSSEGWRGQSLEKLRPEKELERAKLDINRSKLKIRALFQRLDEVCAEGQFPKSLFDSEGLVDSEDIFCAKCGGKEMSLNNDIILCDGACDRGFHQLCLDPPLRTEEIPPGDEGWYCPACDCKFDCVELLNDSMGTKLSISHNFERVFPEATSKAGSAQDDLAGLPSDDSEDDDFNPGGADDDNAESGDSSSDESDFSSASEDLGAIHNTDDQYLGLPSDDSEDDDFEPNFVDAEDQPEQEGSSSDFTSASEDLHAAIENDEVSSKAKNLKSPIKLVQDCEDIVPVSGRRQAEKLDYKKLYDETYGNTSTDSSDDEDWHDAVTPKKRKNGSEDPSHSIKGEEYSVTPKRRRYGRRNVSPPTKDAQAATGGPSNAVRKTRKTDKPLPSSKVGVSNDSQTPENSSGVNSNKKQPYVKLGEDVIQRLYASFEKNQYPDRSTKEKLAEELGLTPKKVGKWFENTRWSVNHPASGDASSSRVTTRGRRKIR